MNNVITSAIGASAITAVSPAVSSSDLPSLGWTVLAAVLSAALSWLTGKLAR